MKIYTKIVSQWDASRQEYVRIEEESFEYDGTVAEMKGGGTQTSTTDTRPWTEQQPYLKDLFANAQNFFNKGTPDTSRSTGMTSDLTGAMRNYASSMVPMNEDYMQRVQEAFNFTNPASNPAFTQYLDLSNQAITKAFNEGVMPGINQGAAMSGGMGGARHGVAQGIAAGNALDTLQRNTAQLTNQAYGQGLDMYKTGMALMPGAITQQGAPLDVMGKATSLQYGLDTQDYQLEKDLLAAYQNLIGGNYGGTSASTTPTGSTGGLAGALGGLAAGGGIVTAGGAAMAPFAPWVLGASTLAGLLS